MSAGAEPTAGKAAAHSDWRQQQRLFPRTGAGSGSLAPPRSRHQLARPLGDVARGPSGTSPLPSGRPRAHHLCLGFPVRTGNAWREPGLPWSEAPTPALGFSGLCAEPGEPTRPPKTSHFHCTPVTPGAAAAEWGSRRPARSRTPRPGAPQFSGRCAAGRPARRGPPCPRQGPPLPRPRVFLTVETTGQRTASEARSQTGRGEGKARQPVTHTHCLTLGPFSPACTVSERSCPGAAVLGNSFNFLALRFNPPELAASSSARSSPRFKGRLKPPLPPPPPPPTPLLAPVPPWC